MDYNFLNMLLDTDSPSGFEINAQNLIMNHMEKYCDEFLSNHSGNLISVLNNNGKNPCIHYGELFTYIFR